MQLFSDDCTFHKLFFGLGLHSQIICSLPENLKLHKLRQRILAVKLSQFPVLHPPCLLTLSFSLSKQIQDEDIIWLRIEIKKKNKKKTQLRVVVVTLTNRCVADLPSAYGDMAELALGV